MEKNFRILVVDDDESIEPMLSDLLSSHGYLTDFLINPNFLFQRLEENPADLILLDIFMPEIDGVTLLKQLKNHPNYKTIPVIILTSDENDEILSKCFDLGAVDFINKPFDLNAFISRVKSAFRTQEYIRKLEEAKKNLEMINRFGFFVSSTLDLEHVLKQILEGTMEAIVATMGVIFIRDFEKKVFLWGASKGFSKKTAESFVKKPLLLHEGLTGAITKVRKPIYIREKASLDKRLAREIVVKANFNTFLGVPIFYEEEVIAVMDLMTRPPEILEETVIPFVRALTSHVGVAIRNAQLYSERRQAEKALKKTMREMEDIMNANPDIMYVFNMEGRLVKWNKGLEELTGLVYDELMLRPVIEFVREQDRPLVIKKMKEVFEKGKSTLEAWFFSKNGTLVPYLCNGVLIKNENGKPIGFTGTGRNITELKRAEKAARKLLKIEHQKVLFESIIASIPDSLVVLKGGSLKIQQKNAAYRNLVLKYPWLTLEMIFNAVNEVSDIEIQQALLGKGEVVVPELFLVEPGDNGSLGKKTITLSVTLTWLKIAAAEEEDGGGEQDTLIVITDITESLNTRRELQKIQKLESLGVIAGGIAHDFNNMLTGLGSRLAIARWSINDKGKVLRELLESEKDLFGAKELAMRLITFSKGGMPIKKTASIKGLLRETVDLALKGSNVKFNFLIAEDLKPVEIDATQIIQVFTNMSLNAKEAMPDQGTLEIIAENVILTAREISFLKEGPYTKIAFQDHGAGIPKPHLSKIFDPYFTTKKSGSGLGLSISYSIIKRHGGDIEVESALGTGTSFFIYLPASEGEIVIYENKGKKEEKAKRKFTKHRIMIMDDNEDIRKNMGVLLENKGHKVVLAKDGEEAIKEYQEAMKEGHPFDAVVLDLTIPGGMGGKETIQRLLKIDANVKAIVVSGYINNSVLAEPEKYGFNGMLKKPFIPEELEEIVNKILDA